MIKLNIELCDVALLKHIEDFDPKRVEWLMEKIISEGVWTLPIALDETHHLVLDGQHRFEVAKKLGLSKVPVVKYTYSELHIESLREDYQFTWQEVVQKALSNNIYPYKTVKHFFNPPLPECEILLSELLP